MIDPGAPLWAICRSAADESANAQVLWMTVLRGVAFGPGEKLHFRLGSTALRGVNELAAQFLTLLPRIVYVCLFRLKAGACLLIF